ncbi:hypothetical protein ACFQ0G_09095 [Streptomyces chiangmaiensis]
MTEACASDWYRAARARRWVANRGPYGGSSCTTTTNPVPVAIHPAITRPPRTSGARSAVIISPMSVRQPRMPGATPSVRHSPAANAATASSSRNSQVVPSTRAPSTAMTLKPAAIPSAFTTRCRNGLSRVPMPQMNAPTLAMAPATGLSSSRPSAVASSTSSTARAIADGEANARWTRSPSRPVVTSDDHQRMAGAPYFSVRSKVRGRSSSTRSVTQRVGR